MRIQKYVLILLAALLLVFGGLAASTAAQTTPTPPAGDTTGGATPVPTPTQTIPLPITADFSYVVRPRDTLDGIAALFDVRLECLRETNTLARSAILQPGDVLLVSVTCPAYDGVQVVEFPRADSPGRTGEDGTYVVQPNDTLDTIAQELDISLEALQAANGIEDGRQLLAGDVLTIPEDAPAYGVVPALRTLAPAATSGSGARSAATAARGGEYVVQPNDTLDTIAQELDVSVQALEVANGITDPRALLPGDVLRIPEDAPPYGVVPALRTLAPAATARPNTGSSGDVRGGQYVVQPNDTLDTIGQALDVSVESLRLANNIQDPRDLLPGDVLNIPEDAPAYGVFPAITTPTGPGTGSMGGEQYVVQRGDTLDTIALDYNVSVVALRVANDIDSAMDLMPGTALIIPADAPAYGAFPSLNEAAGAVIAAGDQYVLQPGDTLDQVGAQFNVDTLCLIRENQIENTRTIRAGQIIGIPVGCPAYVGFAAVATGAPQRAQPTVAVPATQTPAAPPPVQATPTATVSGG